eukprot:5523464-Heterocapsa_arctica.AAC.1
MRSRHVICASSPRGPEEGGLEPELRRQPGELPLLRPPGARREDRRRNSRRARSPMTGQRLRRR